MDENNNNNNNNSEKIITKFQNPFPAISTCALCREEAPLEYKKKKKIFRIFFFLDRSRPLGFLALIQPSNALEIFLENSIKLPTIQAYIGKDDETTEVKKKKNFQIEKKIFLSTRLLSKEGKSVAMRIHYGMTMRTIFLLLLNRKMRWRRGEISWKFFFFF